MLAARGASNADDLATDGDAAEDIPEQADQANERDENATHAEASTTAVPQPAAADVEGKSKITCSFDSEAHHGHSFLQ